MDKYQEIRTILSGRVSFVNGAYSAASSLWKAGFVGMFSGSDTIRFRGVRQAVRQYQSNSVDAGIHTAKNIFDKLGRPIRFQSEPALSACFLRNYLGNPIILVLGETDEGIRVDAYTAPTILSGFHLRHAFQVFEKHLPDDMRPTIQPVEEKKMPQVRESKKEQKARKKMEKLEKKAEQINAKMQAAAQAAKRSGEDSNE